MLQPVHRNGVLVPVLASLVALAWLSLWLWERSPYGRYLNHAQLAHAEFAHDPAFAMGQAALYVGGWVLMTVAMMLPTTIPLLEVFQRMTRDRRDRTPLVALVISGYLSVWLLFGVAAHLFDFWLHLVHESTNWLQANTWVFGAGPLIAAGAFQFSRLKYRCLDKCRAPLSFVVQHWRGSSARVQAFRLGVHHGAFCVGCCWALMLLMFAVGTGSLGWMFALGVAMAIEKNLPWGRRFAPVLGAALLVWGLLIVLDHSYSWQGG